MEHLEKHKRADQLNVFFNVQGHFPCTLLMSEIFNLIVNALNEMHYDIDVHFIL